MQKQLLQTRLCIAVRARQQGRSSGLELLRAAASSRAATAAGLRHACSRLLARRQH
jgi:hypothetical protein